MANIKTNNSCSAQVITYVNVLECQLEREIKALLSQEQFRHLLVNCTICITDSKDAYTLIHDAKMSLSGSLPFVVSVQNFLKKKEAEINQCLSSGTGIEINLKIKESEKKDTNKSNETLVLIPTSPKWNFDQVVLPKETKDEIQEAMNLIKYQKLIYEDWGFKVVDPVAKSVLNFYGPAGTGKTMCAHSVAMSLNKKILACNYSEIESKYVGDAAKNLASAFDTAKKENCVLFFDEADSFLGKRIQNVSQGADQALNSLRSQMLILLENFPGVVLFATNLVSNFDSAFESRILKHIKFDLPNEEARKAIIKGAIPPNLPYVDDNSLTDDDLISLSVIMEGRSGREIKNAILECLLSKATKEGENARFSCSDFSEAFVKKQETLKKLEAEKDRIQKEKIIKAMSRKLDAENEVAAKENGENNDDSSITQVEEKEETKIEK